VVIRSGKIDITPPFLPSLALDIFEQRVRRVYLSATLQNKADIVRAFGRSPEVVIEPSNDAGNGERLIVFERELDHGSFESNFARDLTAEHKVFRRAQRGAFILVSRVDGIDLPHNTCRVMIIEGIPRAESLLEKFQFEYLHMHKFAASRIANRLVQLFGRINRGRSDYGAFLISGHDLNVWLNNDRNVALLPKLLKNQLMLGREVQKGLGVRTLDKVKDLLRTVLLSQPRDPKWLDYYSKFLGAYDVSPDKAQHAIKAEERNFAAALAEAQYAKHVWDGNYRAAREALDAGTADLARSDEKLAGWHNLWIGACLDKEGDAEESWYYFVRARGQLGGNLVVYTGPLGPRTAQEPQSARPIVAKLSGLMTLGRESFEKQFARLERELERLSGGTPSQVEEATRALGELLGFESTRPDNEVGTGPDVMWRSSDEHVAIGLELKTDKAAGSEYSKSEVAQSLDHANWLAENAVGDVAGVVLIGPDAGVSAQANPSSDLYSCQLPVLAGYRDRILATIRDGYRLTPAERSGWLERTLADGWSLKDIAAVLCTKPLKQ
jgi:hypothetical protein